MKKKKCSRCKKNKPLSDFGKCKSFPDGHTYECRSCHNESRRVWGKNNRKASNEACQRYYEKNPEFKLFVNAKRRAKLNGKPFTITRDDIKVPEFCPVLGIRLQSGKGCVVDSSPSLDALVPEKGYVPGNIVVMSHRANTIKCNATLDELKRIVAWLEAQKRPGLVPVGEAVQRRATAEDVARAIEKQFPHLTNVRPISNVGA